MNICPSSEGLFYCPGKSPFAQRSVQKAHLADWFFIAQK